MLVGMWMTRDPVTVAPATSIAEAAVTMSRRGIRRLLVGEPAGNHTALVGVVSSSDLARAFPPDVNPFALGAWERHPKTPVAEVMTRHPLSTTPDTPIEDAASALRERKIGALPVVRHGRIVGIITESDIFRAFLEVVGAADPGVRLTFDLSLHEDAVSVVLDLARRHALRVSSLLTMTHDGRRLGVVRLQGTAIDPFVDAVWRSGHRVLSVIRTEPRVG